jgi:hypothetical protein
MPDGPDSSPYAGTSAARVHAHDDHAPLQSYLCNFAESRAITTAVPARRRGKKSAPHLLSPYAWHPDFAQVRSPSDLWPCSKKKSKSDKKSSLKERKTEKSKPKKRRREEDDSDSSSCVSRAQHECMHTVTTRPFNRTSAIVQRVER